MSEPEDRIAKDKRRFETWGVLIRDIVWSVVGVILIGAAIAGTNAFRTYSAHENDRQEHIWKPLQDTIANLKEVSESAKAGSSELGPTLVALKDELVEVKGLTADLRTVPATVNGRLEKLDGLMASLEGVGNEAKAQIKQNGDAVHLTVLSVTGLVDDQKIKIGNAETALTRAANGLATMIETDNPKIASILDRADKLMISTDGTVTAFKGLVGERLVTRRPDGTDFVSGTGLTGIVENFNGMSLDSRNKLHSIFYPEPAHGFWGHTKQVFGYILNPVLEGGRIYFSLKSLPVRITEPLTIKK